MRTTRLPRALFAIPPLTGAALALLASSVGAQGWTPAAIFPDPSTPRADAAAISFGGQLYAFGGTPLVPPKLEEAPVHELVPGGASWASLTPLDGPMQRVGVGADALGRLIVFGGIDAADPQGDLGKSYWYDLLEGKKDNTAQRSAAAGEDFFAFATDDAQRIYSIGGVPRGTSAVTGQVERYDGTADTWTAVAAMPTPTAAGAAVNDGAGGLLVVGGWTTGLNYSANVARFDVASGSWSDTAIPDLPVATAHLAAARGADGRIYAIGGKTAGGYTADVWVLDATHTAWTAGPSLPTARGHLAAALASDNQIYALGGLDDFGGTAGVEVLFTPSCPEFPTSSAAVVSTWQGLPVQIHVEVVGSAPLTMRWKRDGVELFDGPAPGGGSYAGTATDTLTIQGVQPADEGLFELAVSNACGSATSPVQILEVRVPPELAGLWSVESLHPAGALSSTAYGLADDEVVGSASYSDVTYGQLGHPLTWSLVNGATADLTPAASVGGSISASAGGTQAGWYWWPYQTPQGTAYDKHACVWSGTAGSHIDVQPSGWEHASISDTTGSEHVGTATLYDWSTHSTGAYWPSSQKYAVILTPSGDWGSSANAIHGPHQYGSVIHPFATVHAAKWSGNAASYEDMNPEGSSWSYVLGADEGAQVGRATFGGEHHALLWGGSQDVWVDLHPPGASSSSASETHGGLQVGRVDSESVLWSGTASSVLSIGSLVGPGYAGASANDVRVLPGGDVLVCGSAYNTALARTEALLWRMRARTLEADVAQVSLGSGGAQGLNLDLGPDLGGMLYLVLGSVTGTSPGLPVDGVVLPLVFDPYFAMTLGQAGSGPFQGTLGLLDSQGLASAQLVIPPASNPNFAGLVLYHAGIVFDLAGGGGAAWATNPVSLELVP